MKTLSDAEIYESYTRIANYHKIYLKPYGVKLPKLENRGRYTKDALTLVYLSQNYPNTAIVSKGELTEFIKQFDPTVNDVQQARHLAAQKGWFILSGTRNDSSSSKLRSGEYQLKTLEKPYPGFTAERRVELVDGDYWENLKEKYDYRCACCGSKEGEPHRYMKNIITKLQKGHKNPNKPLEAGNIIPQCETCNCPDRNYWIYDDKGRVVKIANAKVIDHCSRQVQKEMYIRLYKLFDGQSPDEWK